MQVEGSRVLALVPTDGSYFQDVAVQSGDWSDPATWRGGSIPKNMDNVWVPQGVDVTISRDVSQDASGHRVAIHALRVDGMLSFDASPGNPLEKLLVDTIVITGPTVANPDQMGTIQIGTSTNPIPRGVTAEIFFADNGPINAPANTNSALSALWPDGDPYELSRGLIVMGNATLNGTEVTSEESVQPGPTGATDLLPGTVTLTLASTPTNWNVGDQIDVTGDQNIYGVNQDERTTLQSISRDPATGVTTVTIATPLQYLHHAPAGASIYIADLSRNVVIQSENSADVQDRGHVMFMHAVNPEQIDAVGFFGLGRTDKSTPINDPKPIIDPSNSGTSTHPNYIESPGTGTNPRGRYPVHFHHDCQDGAPDTIKDCAVVGSPGWGIVNHSSNVDVTNNVVYNAFGAGFATEAGDEIGAFDHNIAIHLVGDPGEFGTRNADGDFGFEGDGFWFQGGNISVTNNITADAQNGYFFMPFGLVQHLPVAVNSNGTYTFQDLPTRIPASELTWLPSSYVAAALNEPGSTTNLVNEMVVPLKLFSNNVALAAATSGFQAWLSHPLPGAYNVIDRLHIYMSPGFNINTDYSNNFVFNNLVEIGDVNDPGSYRAGYSTNSSTHDVIFNNPDIEGFGYGISVPSQGPTTITGGTLQNILNINIMQADVPHYLVNGVMVNDNQVVTINNVTLILLAAPASWRQPNYNIYYPTNFNLAQPNLAQLYDVNVGSFSTVTIDGRGLYYNEQASDFVPFPSSTTPSYIPANLLDLTNAQILSRYGLAIGGAVAPADAVLDPPGVYGILGDLIAPPPILIGLDPFASLAQGLSPKQAT
jgi:hypothetical protein